MAGTVGTDVQLAANDGHRLGAYVARPARTPCGGSVAWLAAHHLNVSVAVSYYGGDIVEMLNRPPRCPCLVFFAGWDAHVPLADVETIRAAVPESPIYVLPGGHGFACDARPQLRRQFRTDRAHPDASAISQIRRLS